MSDTYSPITREELKAILEPLKDGVQQCVRLLETQNSRIHKAEVDIAILNDRQPNRAAASWGAGMGALVGTVFAIVEFLIKKY